MEFDGALIQYIVDMIQLSWAKALVYMFSFLNGIRYGRNYQRDIVYSWGKWIRFLLS
jgi:hypothetical protein